MNKVRAVSLVLTMALLSVGGVAVADSVSVRDGNDVSSFLDIAGASHGHTTAADQPRKLKHSAWTHDAWKVRHLRNCEGIYFHFAWDGSLQRVVRVFFRDGELQAHMFDARTRELIGEVGVSRRNRRDATVKFSRDLFAPGLESYRWRVLAASTVGAPCESGYPQFIDEAPNNGWRRHNLG